MRALAFFLVFYVGFGLYLYLVQERLVYYPPSTVFHACPELPQAQLAVVNGTRLFVHDVSDKVLVIYQGNAGTVCDRAQYAQAAVEAGWSYVLVSYTGYGDGAGHPSHAGIRRDVDNVVAYLESKSYADVRVLGESIGSGVAGYHASLLPPAALLLITPFDSLEKVAAHHYRWYPTHLLVREAYDTVENLAGYTGAVTVVHGTDDSIIPYERGRALYESLDTTEKRFVSAAGADHNNLWLYADPTEIIQQFLR
jgi:esterase/lipase